MSPATTSPLSCTLSTRSLPVLPLMSPPGDFSLCPWWGTHEGPVSRITASDVYSSHSVSLQWRERGRQGWDLSGGSLGRQGVRTNETSTGAGGLTPNKELVALGLVWFF